LGLQIAMRQIVALALALLLAAALGAEEELPWAFRSGSAEGYSIEPVAAEPPPGTALCAGSEHRFWVKVRYELAVRDTGKIVLVFQADGTEPIARDDKPQTIAEIKKGTGEVEISERLIVPKNAKELWLYVPIVPEAYERTSGELVIRYPIETCQ
jgi:hypothetical protein